MSRDCSVTPANLEQIRREPSVGQETSTSETPAQEDFDTYASEGEGMKWET